jgi:site-specific DNA-methyltransferase (adenine-specific)
MSNPITGSINGAGGEALFELHHGDSMEVMDRLIADGRKIDAVITDPPYDMPHMRGGGVMADASMQKIRGDRLKSICSGYDIPLFWQKWLDMGASNILTFCSYRQVYPLMGEAISRGLVHALLGWHKTNSPPFCYNNWRPDVEWIFHARLPGAYMRNGAENGVTQQHKSRIRTSPMHHTSDHVTTKPLWLMEQLVFVLADNGHTVLDPFMGSGTTGLACMQLGINFIGIELDQQNFEAASRRFEQALTHKRLF